MKIIANYLPQYHRIPENDKFWGEGFTDWVSCRNAKPRFEGHIQPKVPLNQNYYSLDNVDAIKWQANLAKKYGIDGFAIYHYWFNDNLNLLTKPAELLRDNKDIPLEYFFIWDNNSWKRTWSALTGGSGWTKSDNKETKVLAELIYGGKEQWKNHFEYLLPFFKDERYIKKDGKPIFALFNTFKNYDLLKEMSDYWNILARENGLKGVFVLTRRDYKQKQFDNGFIYTPFAPTTLYDYLKQKIKTIKGKEKIKIYNYDNLWKNILKRAKEEDSQTILSGFVNFDDSPRRGNNGNVVIGATTQKFENYLKELLKIATEHKNDFILLTAWNEWGEGCYLEPDELTGYGYLEAVKRAIDECSK